MARLQGGHRRRRAQTRSAGTVASYAILGLIAAIVIYPLILLVSLAFKSPSDIQSDPLAIGTSFRPANFVDAWTIGRFGDYFLNTTIITVPSVIGIVLLSTMAGYALARGRFRGRSFIFYLFILGLIVPFFSYMIPLFFQLDALKLLDTYWAVILPVVSSGLPLGIFLMRAFFQDLPGELADAGRVDGASERVVFQRIMLPLAMPGMAVLAVLAFLQAWTAFLVPLLFLTSEEMRPLSVGLIFFMGGRTVDRELLAAAGLITALPVIAAFVLFQRQFIRGLTAGALKG